MNKIFSDFEAELVGFAHQLTDVSGPIAQRWFRSAIDVELKSDDSPVTLADREIEAMLRAMISDRFPDHGILGEEEAPVGLHSEFVWVIDPIDGTKSFISGMPTFGTLIGVMHNGVPCVGVIDMPALGERWVGAPSKGTHYNGEACRTRGTKRLASANIYSTSPDIFAGENKESFERLSHGAAMRRFGGDCYAYALLASGWVDIVCEAGLQPYDYLALVPIIERAGGVITDWGGRPLSASSDGRVIASATRDLHDEVLKTLGV
ncbi:MULTISPECIES: histidinol-phosphatase [unclassified Burkholderia]|uniref:histidinol-phosphatase n=1 Tax=unclassified Burkholderia TaxID=2613784 RepID=UPI002AAFBD40|nr:MULTISPECIES: histidinol-phosphatase [unclassified Burkholderia]